MNWGVNVPFFPALPSVQTTADLIDDLGVGVVRFLDWTKENQTSEVDHVWRSFSDCFPDSHGFTGGAWGEWHGVRLDVQIEFANRNNLRGWYIIPSRMSAGDIEKFVLYVLRWSKLRPIFEFGNEWWNSMFTQRRDLANRSMIDHGSEWANAHYMAGIFTKMICDIVGDRADVTISFQFKDGEAHWAKWTMEKVSGLREAITAVSVAPYVEHPFKDSSWTILNNQIALYRAEFERVWAYESGQDVRGNQSAMINRGQDIAVWYDDFCHWLMLNFEFANHYSLASGYDQPFGLAEIKSDGSVYKTPKYKSVKSYME